MKKLFIGTRNPKKLYELSQILGSEYDLLSFKDIDIQEVEETEETLEGNAILKAKSYFQQTHLPCIADDTGLMVDILNGEPGIWSARYAGEPADSQKNIQKLLEKLRHLNALTPSERKAHFKTVIAYYDGSEVHTFEGIIHGYIALEPQGNNGFGYDPVFIPEGYTSTFAQMSNEQKNLISHRNIALQKFKNFITLHS